MDHIRAVAFDLFNTLITVGPQTLEEANQRLIRSLSASGLSLDPEAFRKAHHQAAIRHLEECRKEGRETHNRFWIRDALEEQGYSIPSGDRRIAAAVDAYFTAFLDYCRLIPRTNEMLETLRGFYPLGLLSNFTHGPAVRKLLSYVGLDRFFDVVIISGEVGYRKPHPLPFHALVDYVGVQGHQVVYVGDDLEPDILGAGRAGLNPVWTTYVRDHQIPCSPGILGFAEQAAEPGVPRISNWQDFLSLLSLPCLPQSNDAVDNP
jgi:putative hydrolase of the HAD superfamily